MCDISEFVGKTLVRVNTGLDQIDFWFSDGSHYRMDHWQECCEVVTVEDIDTPLTHHLGQEILVAEARTQEIPNDHSGYYDECMQWTFYTIRSNMATSTIRWYGGSNGYYGVGVSIVRLT